MKLPLRPTTLGAASSCSPSARRRCCRAPRITSTRRRSGASAPRRRVQPDVRPRRSRHQRRLRLPGPQRLAHGPGDDHQPGHQRSSAASSAPTSATSSTSIATATPSRTSPSSVRFGDGARAAPRTTPSPATRARTPDAQDRRRASAGARPAAPASGRSPRTARRSSPASAADPFFFDLTGFVGTRPRRRHRQLGNRPTDFFAGLNTNAIVIEVPDDAIGGGNIGVWGATTYWNGGALDRGRPDGSSGDQHRVQHLARRSGREHDQEPVQRHPTVEAANGLRRQVPRPTSSPR